MGISYLKYTILQVELLSIITIAKIPHYKIIKLRLKNSNNGAGFKEL